MKSEIRSPNITSIIILDIQLVIVNIERVYLSVYSNFIENHIAVVLISRSKGWFLYVKKSLFIVFSISTNKSYAGSHNI